MFCPKCGAAEQSAKAYCKRCGEWLPEMGARTGRGFGGETPEQNIFTTLFFSALSSLAALFSAVALYATHTDGGKWSVYFAAGVCLCIAAWQASSFAVGLKLRRRYKRGRSEAARADELGPARDRVALNPADTSQLFEVGSVTEGPTELFEPVPRVPGRDSKKHG